MVQSIDNGMNRPNYNAVKINIKNPTVNKEQTNSYSDDSGIYNAVNIQIDNPTVNTNPKRIYDYPIAEGPITYDMANIEPINLPRGFHVAYQTTNVILPKIENEVEIEAPDNEQETEEAKLNDENENILVEEEPVEESSSEIDTTNNIEPPAANYTTVEAEKAENIVPQTENENNIAETKSNENIDKEVKANEAEDIEKNEKVEIKRPEIIEGEEIKPSVDIPLIISNLTNSDYDIQAQQMEEIARISLDNPQNAVPYIVRDVFSALIDITKKDSANLATPTEEQIDARKKVIANVIALEENPKAEKLPFELTQKEIQLANEISPMEQAERNKEYALYTMAILAKVYTDEVEKQTGNIVPLTDIPGSSAIVDALRYNPNSGVKIAAIDALRHIQRPEYKEELNTIYTLAQADTNPQVSLAATRAIETNN